MFRIKDFLGNYNYYSESLNACLIANGQVMLERQVLKMAPTEACLQTARNNTGRLLIDPSRTKQRHVNVSSDCHASFNVKLMSPYNTPYTVNI